MVLRMWRSCADVNTSTLPICRHGIYRNNVTLMLFPSESNKVLELYLFDVTQLRVRKDESNTLKGFRKGGRRDDTKQVTAYTSP